MERLISYLEYKHGLDNRLIDKTGAEHIKSLLVREGFTRAENLAVKDIVAAVNQEILMANDQVILPGEEAPVPRHRVMTEWMMADTIRMALNWEDVEDLAQWFMYQYDVETLEDVEDIVDDILYN